ncbi:MAG: Holliday junction branch migration protein RuvA [Bdellovibrionaceae bacterium]|nr:Holliday junction branch migration protein RuvA [Bdellovibrionales bacterium]MCB9082804.1 Holliday junction branch migration protein RuvA [Pseudobdellovibrionaceae bacterium]
MIGYLKGEVKFQDGETLILEVQGVGYEVHCSQNTLDEAMAQIGVIQLWIYTHVREDVFQLFGFSRPAEKQLFLSLTKVNGIGPKLALKILSGAPLDHVIRMIEDGDVKGLSRLPKVGKKTAEQMILTLKGKLVLAEEERHSPKIGPREEIISALVNLGFRLNEVEKAIDKVDPKLDVPAGIREGLRVLSSHF